MSRSNQTLTICYETTQFKRSAGNTNLPHPTGKFREKDCFVYHGKVIVVNKSCSYLIGKTITQEYDYLGTL